MKSGIKAFSLTELMIVLVIIAVIFSAMAPLITKRHISETYSNETIWNVITGDPEYSAYFDPGNPTWTSSVYIGDVTSDEAGNSSKLIIKANPSITYNNKTYLYPHMQFRFSNSSSEQSRGNNVATLHLDRTYKSIIFGSYPPIGQKRDTTVYGLSNLLPLVEKNDGSETPLANANGVTVMGHLAMGDAKITESGLSQNIVAIGDSAAKKIGPENVSASFYGIYIGSGAGSTEIFKVSPPASNIAIGYNSMSNKDVPKDIEYAPSRNVFIGAETGNKFYSDTAMYNTIIGSKFIGQNAAYDTIIGYGAYENGDSNIAKLTAIGYGACNSIGGGYNDGSFTCIGYNSAYSTNNTPSTFDTDDGEHIFIGGKPQSLPYGPTFPGRSVLEVHNTLGSESYGNVVINSNLVVRGNFYPSDGDNVVYNVFKTTLETSAESAYYRCSSDSYQNLLNYNNYVCRGLSQANPKSINLLYKGDNCSNADGYTNGSKCPNIISSDVRLKTDISENYDGLEKILKLKPYNYRYKNDINTPMTGVIAQDLQKVFPSAVSVDSNGFLKIRTEDIFFALVNAVKQLANKADSIREKLADIEQNILNIKKDQTDINKDLTMLNSRVKKLEKKWGVNGNN